MLFNILLKLFVITATAYKVSAETDSKTSSFEENELFNNKSDRILSRRRRYLVFPNGSSLQLGKTIEKIEENSFDEKNIFFQCTIKSSECSTLQISTFWALLLH